MNDFVWFGFCVFWGLLVQSFAGFGGGLTAVPLLLMRLDPKEAVPSYAVLFVILNFFLLINAHRHVRWRQVCIWVVSGFPGTFFGALAFAHLPSLYISVGICVLTSLFAILYMMKFNIPLKDTLPTNATAGLLSGFLGAGAAQSGPPVVIFSLSQGWAKDVFRATLMMYFLFLSSMSIVQWSIQGLVTRRTLLMSVSGVAPAAVAACVGTFAKRRAGEDHFRRIILVVILAVCALSIVQKLCVYYGLIGPGK